MFMMIVLILASIGYVATDIYLPALPEITTYFDVRNSYAQLTIAVYLLSFGISPLIFEPLSDRFGRKPIVLFGLIIAILATASCALAENIWWLIGGRFFQGIGLGAVVASARAMIPDRYQGSLLVKYMSILTMFMPIILGLAPPVGGVLQELFSWRTPFNFLLFYILIALVLVFTNLEEAHLNPVKKSAVNVLYTYLTLFKNVKFIAYIVISSALCVGILDYH